jgi:hypothetical protein
MISELYCGSFSLIDDLDPSFAITPRAYVVGPDGRCFSLPILNSMAHIIAVWQGFTYSGGGRWSEQYLAINRPHNRD